MRNIKNMIKGASGAVMSLCCIGVAATQVFAAADTKKVVKDVTDGQGNGTFDELISKITAVGTDAYKLAITVCVIGLLLSLVAIGITLVATKNSTKREENKGWILWIAIGSAVVFGAGAVAEIFIGIGASLSSAGSTGNTEDTGAIIPIRNIIYAYVLPLIR